MSDKHDYGDDVRRGVTGAWWVSCHNSVVQLRRLSSLFLSFHGAVAWMSMQQLRRLQLNAIFGTLRDSTSSVSRSDMKVLPGVIVLLLVLGSQSVSALTISLLEKSPSSLIYSKLLEEIYKRAGIPLEFVVMPTQRSIVESSNGNIDGELVRIHKVGELYPTLIRVPTPFTFFESTAFSKIPDVLPEEGWAGLTDYRVGMVRGMKHAEWGLRDIESVVTVNVTEQLFGMLEYGRIDIAVTSRVSGLYFIKEYDLQPLYVVKPALQNHDLYHYLHEKNKKYIPILDKTIRAMVESGELIELKEKHINELLK